ncbi:hypothetical protein OPV22_002718 [Ensete ventricosum]|uniref:Uncharacterized protein n=1 Tax=Ensete ventricosum TaxID=4639 RepID=A0AAV8RYR6_ENSVE|nr:hypothetical protein OPV22_002718 [Ensete ventricosum]
MIGRSWGVAAVAEVQVECRAPLRHRGEQANLCHSLGAIDQTTGGGCWDHLFRVLTCLGEPIFPSFNAGVDREMLVPPPPPSISARSSSKEDKRKNDGNLFVNTPQLEWKRSVEI